MSGRLQTSHPELDELFERYRAAPNGHVFAPLADACRKAGMVDAALDICARGVAAQPRYASGYVVQGKCLYDARRPADAEAAFRRVLELDAKNLVALKYLGIIHAERGDSKRAHDFFEHILALDPGDKEIRTRIREVREVAAETAAASDDAVEIEDIEDDGFEGASITLRDEKVTSDEIATITLADIYASQGYDSKALKIYREVLRRQPGHPGLSEKIAVLEEKEVAAVLEVSAESPVPSTDAHRESNAAEAEPAMAPAPSVPRPAAAAPVPQATGATIDESRSYEQFKRWLKAANR